MKLESKSLSEKFHHSLTIKRLNKIKRNVFACNDPIILIQIRDYLDNAIDECFILPESELISSIVREINVKLNSISTSNY